MARPRKEGLDYFPHDTDAVSDEKIEALRALYGNNGYAFYFILLERIYRSNDFEIDISDAETIQILAKKIAVTVEEFNNMLKTAFKWKCFNRKIYEERNVLTSNGIRKRANIVVKKREEMRITYSQKVKEKKRIVSKAETTQKPDQKPDKEKKRKVKKSKEEKINIKEEQAPAINKSKKETEPLEFNFEDKCWDGLDDWRIKKFQGRFPMLGINSLLNDNFKQKFLSAPKEYEELIKTKYKGKIEDLVWAWLGQAKKFYLKDHPEYRQEPVETVNNLGRNMSQVGDVIKDLNIKKVE
jgi:hypothetical protein